MDVETGLQYNRARYYDPSAGRGFSQDPLGFDAGDSNLYRYVNDSPTRASDASGLLAISPFDVTIAVAANVQQDVAEMRVKLNITAPNWDGYIVDERSLGASIFAPSALLYWCSRPATLSSAALLPNPLFNNRDALVLPVDVPLWAPRDEFKAFHVIVNPKGAKLFSVRGNTEKAEPLPLVIDYAISKATITDSQSKTFGVAWWMDFFEPFTNVPENKAIIDEIKSWNGATATKPTWWNRLGAWQSGMEVQVSDNPVYSTIGPFKVSLQANGLVVP